MKRKKKRICIFFILTFLIISSCSTSIYDRWKQGGPQIIEKTGTFNEASISESSGIVKSRQYKDIFWTHNDSGNPPVLFAIDNQGKLINAFYVSHSANVDWEDITIDDHNNLYIADMGDNMTIRNDLAIYKLKEPDPFSRTGSSVMSEKIPVNYPESKSDCEATFWFQGRVYIITKTSLGKTTLYMLDQSDKGEKKILHRVQDLNRIKEVTAADYSKQTRLLALLTYSEVVIMKADSDKSIFTKLTRIPLSLKQSEAICWDKEDLIITNEEGELYRIRNLIFE
ncbi:MAG: hypothetical protein ACE5DO_03035 [Desulfobacterales bacterium]